MTKNNKNSNLTKEELDKIQNLVKSINQMQMQIGNFEVQKTVAIQRLQASQREVQAFQAEVNEKYGNVNINVQDGTLSPIPKEDEQVDKKN
jgi:allophanate hydrolase subunit 1|tara:strand:- start:88 stop:360 length:273 start_codon:yes stop_codon:yes gene_type:complete